MKQTFITAMAVAAVMAVPALHAQTATNQPMPATTAPMMKHQGHGGPGQMKMMAELNLTAAQKAQIKAIHAKYEPQMKATRESLRPQMEAARAARANGDTAAARADRAKFRTEMAPMMKIHEQEKAEIRAVLTPEQQQKFDAMKTRGHGMKRTKMAGPRTR